MQAQFEFGGPFKTSIYKKKTAFVKKVYNKYYFTFASYRTHNPHE